MKNGKLIAIFSLILVLGLGYYFFKDFRIIKHPGYQFSSNIKYSNKNNVYLHQYQPVKASEQICLEFMIDEVFIEKEHTHDGGLLSDFDVSNYKYQIIISDSIKNKSCLNGICNYGFENFRWKHSKLHYGYITEYKELDTLIIKGWRTEDHSDSFRFAKLVFYRVD